MLKPHMDVEYPTGQARDIFERLAPEWAKQFIDANRKYKEVDNSLGARGVFPDIYRKVGVLKKQVWDGDPASGREPSRDVILDLIGHLFLMLHMLDEEGAMPIDRELYERSVALADVVEKAAMGTRALRYRCAQTGCDIERMPLSNYCERHQTPAARRAEQ